MREWKHRETSILMQNVMLGSAEKRMVRLISREIIFEELNSNAFHHNPPTLQTDARTDGQVIMAIPRYATHQLGVLSSKIAIFTVRRSALHGLCDRNSVCLSVRLPHSCTVSTWFDLRS